MSEEQTIDFILSVNVEPTRREVQQLFAVLNRTLSILKRLGLPENVVLMMTQLQRAITIMNQARLAALALQAASGPLGWAFALTGVAMTAMNASDFVVDMVDG